MHFILAVDTIKTGCIPEQSAGGTEHEQASLELFASEPESFSIHETDRALIKNHSIRSLITSLESFTAFSITWVEPGSKTLTRISARFSHSILQKKAESAETERLPTRFPLMKAESFIRCFFPASCLTASGSGSASATGDKKHFLVELSRISTVDLEELMNEEEGEKEEKKKAEPA